MKKRPRLSDCYEDIVNLPRHRSRLYPAMPREKRAAQFSPFAALSGHEDAIREKSRFTERKIEFTESKKQQINTKLLLIKEQLNKHPQITVTYFVPDGRKSGGAYVTETGIVTKISEFERLLVLGQKSIPIDDISAVDLSED